MMMKIFLWWGCEEHRGTYYIVECTSGYNGDNSLVVTSHCLLCLHEYLSLFELMDVCVINIFVWLKNWRNVWLNLKIVIVSMWFNTITYALKLARLSMFDIWTWSCMGGHWYKNLSHYPFPSIINNKYSMAPNPKLFWKYRNVFVGTLIVIVTWILHSEWFSQLCLFMWNDLKWDLIIQLQEVPRILEWVKPLWFICGC